MRRFSAGTTINYSELNTVAAQPFQQKVDWLKGQLALLL